LVGHFDFGDADGAATDVPFAPGRAVLTFVVLPKELLTEPFEFDKLRASGTCSTLDLGSELFVAEKARPA
jgi:hypothetical protein